MAAALTSNSFLPTTPAPSPRSHLKNRRQAVILAKRAGPFAKRAESGEADQDSNPPAAVGFFDLRKLAQDVKSLVPAVAADPTSGLSFGGQRRKDPGTVFVAGGAGQAGIRIAQALLRRGFSVRAGVPDLGAAQELARLASDYKIISGEESKRLNAVSSDFEDAESIAKAIGNASKVVVTIGPSENGPTAEVTASDALQVVRAAQLAKVGHVAVIYDSSSGPVSTYNVLDGISSFFNNLFARSQPLTVAEFLQELVKIDVSYTLFKTKLTDDFALEGSYNVVVSAEGGAPASAAANDYKVTKSQIASLVADVFSNTAVAENKVVEVFTDPSAVSKEIAEVLSTIPEDSRRKEYAEALAIAKAEEEANKASEQAEIAKNLEEQESQASSLATEAQKKVQSAAEASVESFLTRAKGVTSSWENLSSQIKSAVQKTANGPEPKVRVATVRGQAKARSLPSVKAVVKKPSFKPKNVSKQKDNKTTETRKVFGGLFKQETIYIDDD
ncbi:plastid transcriptionally active 16 [Striga hermonthica]|uniref:Plastid transcriptionally active 16 n=1 Tax=Striga hermonthica TaxID=68872 RepID=A0A9N7NLI9_STRHE|nr:plastid transcriptionally active 16 [Striga hermonthica]